MTEKYKKFFAEIHWNIRPFSHKELAEICVKKEIDIKEFKYRDSSYLFSNACMAEKCEHFLKITKTEKLTQHLDSWCGNMPMGYHKFILKNLDKDKEWVLENFLLKFYKLETLNVTKEFALSYIEQVQSFYKSIPEEEIKAENSKIDKVKGERGRGIIHRGHGGRGRGRGGKGKNKSNRRGRGRGYKGNVNEGEDVEKMNEFEENEEHEEVKVEEHEEGEEQEESEELGRGRGDRGRGRGRGRGFGWERGRGGFEEYGRGRGDRGRGWEHNRGGSPMGGGKVDYEI